MRVIVWGGDGALTGRFTGALAADRLVSEVVTLLPSGRGHRRAPAGRRVTYAPDAEVRPVDPASDLSPHLRFADALVLLPRGGRWGPGPRRGRGAASGPRELAGVASQARDAGVRVLVHCSTASAYSPAPPGQPVDEQWPADGRPWSPASVAAAGAEHAVDRVAAAHPAMRTVRLRAGYVVTSPDDPPASGETDAERRSRRDLGRRLVAGAAANRRLRLAPDLEGAAVQPLHVDDLAAAVVLALTEPVTGAYNVASDPVDTGRLAAVLDARAVRLPRHAAGRVLRSAGRLGLHGVDPAGLEQALEDPVLTTRKARDQLGWRCRRPSGDILVAWAAELARTRAAPGARRHAAGPAPAPAGGRPPRDPGAPPPGGLPSPAAQPATLGGLRSLYEQALDYVGRQVHALDDDAWHVPTQAGGPPVWDVVARAARDQYRLAMALRDDPPAAEVIEARLPDDPLGIARADGWDLATERSREVLGALDGDEPADRAPGTAATRALPDAICEVALLGTVVAEATGGDPTMAGELSAYVAGRMGLGSRDAPTAATLP